MKKNARKTPKTPTKKSKVCSPSRNGGIPFDDSVPNLFRARLKSSPIDDGMLYEFTMQPPSKAAGHLTYDAVEEVAYSRLDELYPDEYYPRAEVGSIKVKGPSGEWFPVVRESCDHDIERCKKERMCQQSTTTSTTRLPRVVRVCLAMLSTAR